MISCNYFGKGIGLTCITQDLTEKKYAVLLQICFFVTNAGALNKSTWLRPGLLFPESTQALLNVFADIEIIQIQVTWMIVLAGVENTTKEAWLINP